MERHETSRKLEYFLHEEAVFTTETGTVVLVSGLTVKECLFMYLEASIPL